MSKLLLPPLLVLLFNFTSTRFQFCLVGIAEIIRHNHICCCCPFFFFCDWMMHTPLKQSGPKGAHRRWESVERERRRKKRRAEGPSGHSLQAIIEFVCTSSCADILSLSPSPFNLLLSYVFRSSLFFLFLEWRLSLSLSFIFISLTSSIEFPFCLASFQLPSLFWSIAFVCMKWEKKRCEYLSLVLILHYANLLTSQNIACLILSSSVLIL